MVRRRQRGAGLSPTTQQAASSAAVLTEALERVRPTLAGVRRLAVAYSGGVDSATLLALAVRLLGADRVVAVLGVSPSLAAAERSAAHEVAAVIGAPLVEVATHEGQRPAYVANGPDRCFHCKDELFTVMDELLSPDVVAAQSLPGGPVDALAYGENADVALRPDRPGARAATEHRVLRPPADAGLTKAQVRDVARQLRLPCADKPAAPCLASRIPHDEVVTPEKLAAVERAEAGLRALGFAESRVRHHGDVARVEVPTTDLARAVELRVELNAAVRAAGFRYAALDLAGLQSGAFTLTALDRRAEGPRHER